MAKKLTPDQEMMASHIAATTAAFQVLILCLQQNGALAPGQVAEGLRDYLEITEDLEGTEMKRSFLNDLRQALVN